MQLNINLLNERSRVMTTAQNDNNKQKSKYQRIKEIAIVFPKIAQILANDLAEQQRIHEEFMEARV